MGRPASSKRPLYDKALTGKIYTGYVVAPMSLVGLVIVICAFIIGGVGLGLTALLSMFLLLGVMLAIVRAAL